MWNKPTSIFFSWMHMPHFKEVKVAYIRRILTKLIEFGKNSINYIFKKIHGENLNHAIYAHIVWSLHSMRVCISTTFFYKYYLP